MKINNSKTILSFGQPRHVGAIVGILWLLATSGSLGAQTGNANPLIELRGSGDVQVLSDGRLVETRNSRRVERQLSPGQMRRVRELMNQLPCPSLRKAFAPDQQPSSTESKPTFDFDFNTDCLFEYLGYGKGLHEILLTLHYPDGQVGPLPLYVICPHSTPAEIAEAKESYERHLKVRWQRLLHEIIVTLKIDETTFEECGSNFRFETRP